MTIAHIDRIRTVDNDVMVAGTNGHFDFPVK